MVVRIIADDQVRDLIELPPDHFANIATFIRTIDADRLLLAAAFTARFFADLTEADAFVIVLDRARTLALALTRDTRILQKQT